MEVRENEEIALCVSNDSKCQWIIDSGATSHMTCDIADFCEYESGSHQNIAVANGVIEKVQGVGVCKIILINEDGIEVTA